MNTLIRVSSCHNGLCKPELDQIEDDWIVGNSEFDCTCSEIDFEGKHIVELNDSGELIGEWCLWHSIQLRLD